jgi:hypothetical protein
MDAFQLYIPFEGAWDAPGGQSKHYNAQFFVGQLCGGLHCDTALRWHYLYADLMLIFLSAIGAFGNFFCAAIIQHNNRI